MPQLLKTFYILDLKFDAKVSHWSNSDSGHINRYGVFGNEGRVVYLDTYKDAPGIIYTTYGFRSTFCYGKVVG